MAHRIYAEETSGASTPKAVFVVAGRCWSGKRVFLLSRQRRDPIGWTQDGDKVVATTFDQSIFGIISKARSVPASLAKTRKIRVGRGQLRVLADPGARPACFVVGGLIQSDAHIEIIGVSVK